MTSNMSISFSSKLQHAVVITCPPYWHFGKSDTQQMNSSYHNGNLRSVFTLPQQKSDWNNWIKNIYSSSYTNELNHWKLQHIWLQCECVSAPAAPQLTTPGPGLAVSAQTWSRSGSVCSDCSAADDTGSSNDCGTECVVPSVKHNGLN